MKTKNIIISFFLMFFIGTCVAPAKVSAQDVSVSFQVFYDELSPYGTWIDNAEYGYVWYPNVSAGFSPYSTNGYWVFTDEGWTWVSDYAWGWAPFHYGRWYTDYVYGPMWIPDNQWGPGWVSWRRSNGYYGWAPIGPGVSVGVAYSNDYNLPYDQWTFVRERDFGRVNINNYYINTSNNVTIFNNSTVINNVREDKARNVSYSSGPERSDVEKSVGTLITTVSIKESNQPGQNLTGKQLQIYRPQMQKNNANESKSVPSKVENLRDVKTLNQRTGKDPSQKLNQQNNQNPSQFQKSKPFKKEEGFKQQQGNPYQKNEGIKQQQGNPYQKNEGIKQQQENPYKKENGTKQQQRNPSKKEEGIKQNQGTPTKKTGDEKRHK